MDFASNGRALVADTGTPMQLVDPTDDFSPLYAIEDPEKGWTVTLDAEAPGARPCILRVVGQDSRAYRRRRHELVDALRARQKAMKSAQIEAEALKMVAAGVIGWENIPWSDPGEKAILLPFNDENLLAFLDLYRPAFDQVNDFIGQRSNFLPRG